MGFPTHQNGKSFFDKGERMQKLIKYFTEGVTSHTMQTIGMEIETQFVDDKGDPISTDKSQEMFMFLAQCNWAVEYSKGNRITKIVDRDGNQISYELGRHNIEISTAPSTPENVIVNAKKCLNQLYQAAKVIYVKPCFVPVLYGSEDLLMIPDERDAIWLQLDGREALAPLARTSSVQFTISVNPEEAIRILNHLGRNLYRFLDDYPQEEIWRLYIANSKAGYLPDRYGGPLHFESLENYCEQLTKHAVVQGPQLIPYADVKNLDIPLYLRSIWWYFRLKRYGNSLCIEVRPLSRKQDEQFYNQLKTVMNLFDQASSYNKGPCFNLNRGSC